MSKTIQTKRPPAVKAPVDVAALDNLSPWHFQSLGRMGFTIVVCRFAADGDSPIWNQSGIEHDLGQRLISIEAGYFDASSFRLGAQFHIYHVRSAKLGPAVAEFKAELDRRGLLEISRIYNAETAAEWREWYPGTAEMIRPELAPQEAEA